MVHKTNKVLILPSLPTAENGKQNFGIHKSSNWLQEVDHALKEKERAIEIHEKEIEQAEQERSQRWEMQERIEELAREKESLEMEKEALQEQREELLEKELGLEEREKVSLIPSEPIMPKIKEEVGKAVEVGKKVAKLPEKIFFPKKNGKKVLKEAGIDVIE